MSASTAVLDDAKPGVLARAQRSLTPGEWAAVGGIGASVLALHVIGWFSLIALIAPHHYQVTSHQAFGIGLGITAYTLGMRHAFDADHIAAIDNTTRKLMADGKRPVSVGFWFSLGHSTIVFGLCVLLALGVRSIAGQVQDEKSSLHSVTELVGTSVSGTFLYVIGILNLVILVGIVRVFRAMRAGTYDENELQRHLDSRGFMNRFLNGLTRSVRKPWHIYPVGVLFGLGFDTATKVGLLVVAGDAATLNLPFYAILVLPVLFAAGMCLMDTIDGVFMNAAYGWAFAKPVRKVFYNITITAISVAVALVIGTIELIGVLADRLDITTGPIAAIANVPLDYAGYAIVVLFVGSWALALAVWRYGRIEEKWSADLAPSCAD